MAQKPELLAYIMAGAGALTIAFIGYVKIWELTQPKQTINNAQVTSVTPYTHNSELGVSSGYKITIAGREETINLPLSKWDHTVSEGDSVDLVVRQCFPLLGGSLEGFSIDDHK